MVLVKVSRCEHCNKYVCSRISEGHPDEGLKEHTRATAKLPEGLDKNAHRSFRAIALLEIVPRSDGEEMIIKIHPNEIKEAK